MKKIFSLLIALALVLSFSLVTAAPVGANTDRLVPSQYATIQLAINAASPGDTIIVAAGTYDESGLKINKSLTISGTGTVTITGTKGSFDTDLKFHGTGAPGTQVLGSMDYVVGVYNSADVDFVNITIDGANNLSDAGSGQYFAGVAFYNAQGSFSGCEIKRTASNPESCDGAAVSIYIDTDSGTWELEVKDNCIFNTWPKNAISAYGSGTTLSNVLTLDIDNSTFTGNDGSGPSSGFQNGIVGLAGLDIEVDHCTFSAIRPASGTYWAAPVLAGYAYKDDSTRYAPAHDLTVNNCTFSVTGDKYVRRSGGVWITTTGTAVVEDCTFTNIKGISVDGSNSCDGVPGNFNPSSQDVTIRNCTFNGPSYPASVSYYMCGVNIQRGAQVDVEGCTFNGFHDDDNSDGEGVCFCSAHFDPTYYTGSTGGSVTGCTFSDCVLAVYSGTDVTPLAINFNNFDGTNGYGVWNNDAAAIDALYNWWGDATGPSHTSNPHGTGQGGDEVSDNVDFIPWYATETTTPTTDYVSVEHPGSSIIAYSDTIQGGIDAALSGDTIIVHAGTYNEHVIADKALTLNGANAGIPGTGTRGAESIIDADYDGDWNDDGITIASGGVTVDGFKIIEADDPIIAMFSASTGNMTNIIIKNNYIDNAAGATRTSGTEGICFIAMDGHYSADGAVIKNNYIKPSQDTNAMSLDGVTGSFTIEGNTMEDARNGLWLSACSNDFVWYGRVSLTGTEIKDNIIQDLRCSWSTGIGLSYVDGDINITGNTVACNVSDSIGLQSGSSWHESNYHAGSYATGLNIQDNDIYNNGWAGVYLIDGSDDINIHWNNIYNNASYGVYGAGAASVVNALYNWWGDVTGPSHDLNLGGQGDTVSDNVDFSPWLYKTQEQFVSGAPCYAGSVVLGNEATEIEPDSYAGGWNSFSTPITLDTSANTVSELLALTAGSGLSIERAQRFDLASQAWVVVIMGNMVIEDYQIKPGEGLFIQVSSTGSIPILVKTTPTSPPMRDLVAGWNLIGMSSLGAETVETALSGISYSVVLSPKPPNDVAWSVPPDGAADKELLLGEAYWVAMGESGILFGFTTTPVADDMTWELNQ